MMENKRENYEGDGNEDDDFHLDDQDIVRVIDLEGGEGDAGAESGEEMEDEEGAEGDGNAAVEDKAAVVFSAHKDKPQKDGEFPEVYAIHIDPSGSGRVVTGGRDETAFVWVMNSGKILFECTGHKESVSCVGFSHDGRYVASADMEGVVKVWHCGNQAEVFSYECGSEVLWLRWHPAAHVLLAGTGSGDVWMWQVPDWSKMKLFQSHGFPSRCGKILTNGIQACVGYADGGVKLWNMRTGKAEQTWQHSVMPDEEMKDANEGHEELEEESPVAIFSVDCSADNSLIMSGCADCTVKIFHATNGKLVSMFKCAGSEDEKNSVESVAFCPSAPYAAISTINGAVEIWDLPSSALRHNLQHPEGVCKVSWSSSAQLLYTAGVDGVTRVWDARNAASKAELTGHSKEYPILDFDVTKDGTCLVSASGDGTARVFDLRFLQS